MVVAYYGLISGRLVSNTPVTRRWSGNEILQSELGSGLMTTFASIREGGLLVRITDAVLRSRAGLLVPDTMENLDLLCKPSTVETGGIE